MASGFAQGQVSSASTTTPSRPWPSEDGSTGYDEYGWPTQGNLWLQAKSRRGRLPASPARRTWHVEPRRTASRSCSPRPASTPSPSTTDRPATGSTRSARSTSWTSTPTNGRASLIIVYDGDADPGRKLRSPDNLVWADDGFIYVQEDEAEEDTLSGDEVLFGPTAVNENEAGIVRVSTGNQTLRVMNIDRSVVLDPSIATPTDAVDVDAGDFGEWESSGIIDVSSLFGDEPGSLFLFNVQAHGIEDQDQFNPASRIIDSDLVEGGQLLFLEKN